MERVLFLSLPEMQIIRDYFRCLGRDPSDVELETLAQTWSEHCQHKAFKAHVHYVCRGGMSRLLPGGRAAPGGPRRPLAASPLDPGEQGELGLVLFSQGVRYAVES